MPEVEKDPKKFKPSREPKRSFKQNDMSTRIDYSVNEEDEESIEKELIREKITKNRVFFQGDPDEIIQIGYRYTAPIKKQVDFLIRLYYDGLSRRRFFVDLIDNYLEGEPKLLAAIDVIKEKRKVPKQYRERALKELKETEEMGELIGLNDEEREDLFDQLELEFPDL